MVDNVDTGTLSRKKETDREAQSSSGNQGFSFALAEAVLSSNRRLVFNEGDQNAAALPGRIELEARDSLF